MSKVEKVKLAVKERIMLLNILPKAGDILTIKLVRELKEELSIGEAEGKTLDLKISDQGAIQWNAEAAEKAGDKGIEIGDTAKELIVKTLKELDKQKELSEDHILLWDKFCQ